MTNSFYALPYNISVEGFYFQTFDHYRDKAAKLIDSFGQPVEELQIQFIDGGQIDCELFEAWGVDQTNLADFIQATDDWNMEQKMRCIAALHEGGYPHTEIVADPDALDLTLYHVCSLKELAEQFVDEGFFGDIPERLASYIDFEMIARDLHHDGYCEAIIAGERLIYRMD